MTPSSPSQTSRRGFLAVLGTTTLAGCSSIFNRSSDESKQIDEDALQSVFDRGAPDVPDRLPVFIQSAYLEESEARADALLEPIPDLLTADDVPNEVVRNEIERRRERAKRTLADAYDADSPFEAMQSYRRARKYAAHAATIWNGVENDLSAEDVAAVPDLRDRFASFRENRQYVGGNVEDAVIVHEELEQLVERIQNDLDVDLDQYSQGNTSVLVLGELAENIEAARATVEDAEYLYERYVDGLDAERDLERTLADAVEKLGETVVERTDFPLDPSSVNPDDLVDRSIDENDPVAELLDLAYFYAAGAVRQVNSSATTAEPATAVMNALRALYTIRAFEQLRERVENGETFRVETAAEIRSVRTEAIEAIEHAVDSAQDLRLHWNDVSLLATQLNNHDELFQQFNDGVSIRTATEESNWYVWIPLQARALPEASSDVVDVLEAVDAGE